LGAGITGTEILEESEDEATTATPEEKAVEPT